MAKINSSGAKLSRLDPPGSCNHSAISRPILIIIPDKISSKAKSIPCNEICIEYKKNYRIKDVATQQLLSNANPRHMAQVCFFRRLTFPFSLKVSLPAAGIIFFYGRRFLNCLQVGTGDAAPQFRPVQHRKKRTLSLS